MDVGNWIAVYAAGLSTVIAVIGAIRWLTDGPKLAVYVFRPDEYWVSQASIGMAVSNAGKAPTVISGLDISCRTSKGRNAQEIGELITVDQRSQMSPSMIRVPDPHKPNHVSLEPRVLAPGDEFIGQVAAPAEYEASKHWVRIRAYARNTSRTFTGWAQPITTEETK